MSADALPAVAALNQRFLLDYPGDAARELESMPAEEAAALLAPHVPRAVVRAWEALAADFARAVLEHLPEALAQRVLAEAEPAVSAAVLTQLEPAEREKLLSKLDKEVARELRELAEYPQDCAGRLMDARVIPLRAGMTVSEAIERLRAVRRGSLRELYVVDDAGRLAGRVEMQDLALAERDRPLAEIMHGVIAVVRDLDPREEVVEILQREPITVLPVVNQAGRLLGVIRQAKLMAVVEEEASVDIQTMVGASPDERALSRPWFAVRKRLPWLQVNLFTAFLAASVVGFFESTIAQFTALAVLMPMVAGQSGNAGGQALAVTMRGLALREISVRHWPRMVWKESAAGLVNGLAVAATAGVGVYVWSGQPVLVGVFCAAMVVSMAVAGLAGALVPILMSRLGQDPATASAIFVTTVTDVVGFFSFLGFATLFAGMLVAG